MPDLCEYEENEFVSHFQPQVSQAIVDYATEVAFRWSRYIFTRRHGKQQYGYCTHCRKEFKLDGLKHNSKTICPECKSKCTVKASGMGRKKMIDEVYFVYYEKSTINPQTIVARGIYAIRDYRFDYHNVETFFATRAMYVFEMGNSRMIKRWMYYSGTYGKYTSGHWEKRGSVYSLFNQDHIARISSVYSRESIKEAVKGTPFSWSGWEKYDHEDMVRFFDLYARYPCVEYLTKLGFMSLVKDKMLENRTYNAINWRGKNLFKVLKLTKQELNTIKQHCINVTFELLKIMQISRKDGSNLSPTEASMIAMHYGGYIDDLEKMRAYGDLRKMTNYFGKQHEKHRHHFGYHTSVLITWRDYIADCRRLGLNLSEESVLFPRNLHRAHQNTIKQIKVKEDEMLNKKIRARLKSLEKYSFEHEQTGLMLRPAADSKELINEGKGLNHCVGTYAQRYASGETNIFFVRKISEPDKPYFTVEVKYNEVRQVRGKNNCTPGEDVNEFMDAFINQRLRPENKKGKVKSAVPA